MKNTTTLILALCFCVHAHAQTTFMPIGSIVSTEYRVYRGYGTAVFNAIKDTVCNGIPCRKIVITKQNRVRNETFFETVYYKQQGDSIFEYNEYLKKFGFLFKNKYNVKDSLLIQDSISNFVFTQAIVYIDSVLSENNITRYACRMKCLARSSFDTTLIARFNLYDKFIPDLHWNLHIICMLNFYDGYYYKPLCYSDAATSYRTPNFTGSCDTIKRLTIVQDTTQNTDIQIFPNPANTYFTIKSNPNQSKNVLISSINGVHVLQKRLSVSNNVDVHDLPNGIYIVTLVSDLGVSITQKLIIHH
jgi:hypothetical protein